jgi:hypothetical protein
MLLSSSLMLVTLLAAVPGDDPGLALVPHVVGVGCAPHLLGKKEHAFWEAQIACDAYLGLHLVDEVLAGKEKEPRVRALLQLLDDAQGRGQKPFLSLGVHSIEGVKFSSSILSRGYLLLLFSGLARIDALPAERVAVYDGLAASVVDDLKDGVWWESFRGGRWPCDHALAAAGLLLHGNLRANATSTTQGRALVDRLLAELRKPGSFVTRVHKDGTPIEREPRGVTLAWTAGFLALADRDAGRAFADVLVRDFCDDPAFLPGVAACREWPRGNNHAADAVSGPIVLGYGTGASALALAATQATGLATWAMALNRLSQLAPATGRFRDVEAEPAKWPLENAILLWGRSATTWLNTAPAP